MVLATAYERCQGVKQYTCDWYQAAASQSIIGNLEAAKAYLARYGYDHVVLDTCDKYRICKQVRGRISRLPFH